MLRRVTLGLCLLGGMGTASAQGSGGVAVAPASVAGLAGLAQLPAFTLPGPTAADLQGTVPAAERSARHRNVVTRVRGDGGFLDGFAFGQPVALSRAPVGPPLGAGISLVQNFNGPITSGSNTNQVFAGPGSTIASQLVVCGDAGEDRESPVDGVRIALVCDGSSNVAITDHEGSGRGP